MGVDSLPQKGGEDTTTNQPNLCFITYTFLIKHPSMASNAGLASSPEASDQYLQNEFPPQTGARTNTPGHDGAPIIPATRPLSTLVFYFMAIHFLLAFCEIILVAPLIKLFENSLCLNHYGFQVAGVEEALCKIPEIQQPLATIRGWKSTFDTIPGILNFMGIVEYN